MFGDMSSSRIIVVQGACRLARRSSPTEAGELAGRARRNLDGYWESCGGVMRVMVSMGSSSGSEVGMSPKIAVT